MTGGPGDAADRAGTGRGGNELSAADRGGTGRGGAEPSAADRGGAGRGGNELSAGAAGMRFAAGHLWAALRLAWTSSRSALSIRVPLAVAVAFAPVAVSWLIREVLNRITGPATVPLLPFAVALAVVGVAGVLLPQVIAYLDGELRRGVTLHSRQRLYQAVGRLSGLARLENPRFHDRLQLAAHGAGSPADVVTQGLGAGQGAITVAAFLATLAVLNPWMAAIVAVAAIPTLRTELVLSRQRAAMQWDLSHATRREHFYSRLLTSLTSAHEVRLFGLENLFTARMTAELEAIGGAERRLDRRELASQAALGLFGAAVAGGGLVWAVGAARSGRLTVGDVAVFVAAVAGVQAALAMTISGLGQLHSALLSFGHFRHILATEPDLRPPPDPAPPVPPLRRGIELRDVWFRYGDDQPWVLRGVNLTLPAGQATALVGLNGAGKSTVVKLLCRLYDPVRGAVLWDGVDLRDLPVARLRRRVSAVFQSFAQYELSVAENIGVGDVDALDDRERIVAAAVRAGVHETVLALPQGYDTMLTRIFLNHKDKADPGTGTVLSGGQWQRIALSRALMRGGCDLLVLDEPSAGLDAVAEHEVHRRLREHRRGRTSLLISHRLSAVRDADRIVVLADGVVTQEGTHDKLLAAGGAYAELFTLQAAGYRE